MLLTSIMALAASVKTGEISSSSRLKNIKEFKFWDNFSLIHVNCFVKKQMYVLCKHFDISFHHNVDTEALSFHADHMNFDDLCPVGIGQLLTQKDLTRMHLLSPWDRQKQSHYFQRCFSSHVWGKTDTYLEVTPADFADNIPAGWIYQRIFPAAPWS